MRTGLGLKRRSILGRKTGQSHRLPGVFFCIRPQQAKANERLYFAGKLASGVRYYMYREKWGSRYGSTDLHECGPHPVVLQGAKGLARRGNGSSRQEETSQRTRTKEREERDFAK